MSEGSSPGSIATGRSPARLARTPIQEARRTLRTLLWPLIGLLVLEFLLGMTLDLYVSLPTGSVATVLWSSPVLIVHLILGILLVGITTRAVVVSARTRDRKLVGASGAACASAVVAFGAGSAFAFAGQNPAASFVMSAGFIGILLGALLLFWWTSSVLSESATVEPIEAGVRADAGTR